MARAIDTFNKTINRCNGLIRMFDQIQGQPAFSGHNTSDLLRSALVLAVSGMDAYFTSRFSESLVKYLKSNSPSIELIEILTKAGLDVKQSLEMISMERPHRRIRTLVDQYLSNYTTQRLDVIDKLFRVYGIANLTKNAQGLSGKKKLLKNVEASVSRRNEIAHAGDYNSHDKLQEIARDKTEKQIGNIKLFVEKSEELIFKIIK